MSDEMPTPPNDDSKLLFKLLADLDWHSFYEIRDAVAERVSPGRAIRAYEHDLNYRRQQKGNPNYDSSLSDDARVEIGRRKLASIAISSWRDKGVIVQGEGRDKEIKVKPGFTSWGIPGFEPNQGVEGESDAPDPPAEGEGSGGVSPAGVVAAEAFPWVSDDRILVGVADLSAEVAVVEDPVAPVLLRCETCGLGVLDEALHEKWHHDQGHQQTPAAMALLNESQLREVFTDVMEHSLDQFQRGMQDWLIREFAQIHAAVAVHRPSRARWITRSDQHPV